jgi:hypothetical protein
MLREMRRFDEAITFHKEAAAGDGGVASPGRSREFTSQASMAALSPLAALASSRPVAHAAAERPGDRGESPAPGSDPGLRRRTRQCAEQAPLIGQL